MILWIMMDRHKHAPPTIWEEFFSVFGTLSLFIVLSLSTPLHASGAGEVTLLSPIDCAGSDCFIQRMPDQQLGIGFGDHRCGPLSSNGYTSTDFRVVRVAELQRRIPVVASLGGVVEGVRDGMPDGIFSGKRAAFLKGKECGNGVYIRHDGGWKTQYCHLRKGSILVVRGERVVAGQKLGEMGLSGLTNFPHLEFRVQRNGTKIDPFTGDVIEAGCGSAQSTLWVSSTVEGMIPAATQLVSAGFANKVPTLPEVVLGLHDRGNVLPESPALLFWVEVTGVEKGDVEHFSIIAPDGTTMIENISAPYGSGRALHLGYAGKKLSTPLKRGEYTGAYRLVRKGNEGEQTVVSVRRKITVTDKEQ